MNDIRNGDRLLQRRTDITNPVYEKLSNFHDSVKDRIPFKPKEDLVKEELIARLNQLQSGIGIPIFLPGLHFQQLRLLRYY